MLGPTDHSPTGHRESCQQPNMCQTAIRMATTIANNFQTKLKHRQSSTSCSSSRAQAWAGGRTRTWPLTQPRRGARRPCMGRQSRCSIPSPTTPLHTDPLPHPRAPQTMDNSTRWLLPNPGRKLIIDILTFRL